MRYTRPGTNGGRGALTITNWPALNLGDAMCILSGVLRPNFISINLASIWMLSGLIQGPAKLSFLNAIALSGISCFFFPLNWWRGGSSRDFSCDRQGLAGARTRCLLSCPLTPAFGEGCPLKAPKHEAGFAARAAAATQAKREALELFRQRTAAPVDESAKAALAHARSEKIARRNEKEAQRQSRLAAEKAAKIAEAEQARLDAERGAQLAAEEKAAAAARAKEEAEALAREQKAARDAKYAARKARKG